MIEIFPKLEEGERGALVMFRDTGANGGPYPELDSGKAIEQLAKLVKDQGFTPVICGKPQIFEYFGEWNEKPHTIKEYYNELHDIKSNAKVKSKASERDIDALFMKQAFEDGKFKLVLGFRSGALDLFIGIPTVSITLKGLEGNKERHDLLKGNNFQRLNIEYNMPRHKTTNVVGGEVLGEKKPYYSPFWDYRKDSGRNFSPTKNSEQERQLEPGQLDRNDIIVITEEINSFVSKLKK